MKWEILLIISNNKINDDNDDDNNKTTIRSLKGIFFFVTKFIEMMI